MWHSGVLVDGAVHMWGKGSAGRLGCGDEEHRLSPTQIHIPPGTVLLILMDSQHSRVQIIDWLIFCWFVAWHALVLFKEHADNIAERSTRSAHAWWQLGNAYVKVH
jgi:hypothetical protein